MERGHKRKALRLTRSLIKSLVYQGRQGGSGRWSRDVQWDAVLPGFGVRLLPSGKKAFVINYRIKGVKRLKTLGHYPKISLEEASSAANRGFAALLYDEDPFSAEIEGAPLKRFSEVCEEYLTYYAKEHKKSWRSDENMLNKHVLPRFGKRRIASITHAELARLHFEISKTARYQANRVIEVLSVLFRLAIQWGYHEGENPAKGIRANKERKRDRWVTPQCMSFKGLERIQAEAERTTIFNY